MHPLTQKSAILDAGEEMHTSTRANLPSTSRASPLVEVRVVLMHVHGQSVRQLVEQLVFDDRNRVSLSSSRSYLAEAGLRREIPDIFIEQSAVGDGCHDDAPLSRAGRTGAAGEIPSI
jgi:hypothetical protein